MQYSELKQIEWIKSNPIAHRGLHDKSKGVIENSISAFNEAIKYHYPIEMDVQLTKDSEVIVFHDTNLMRLTGLNQEISNSNLNDLIKIKLLNSNDCIPSFAEALHAVNSRVPIIVELKDSKKQNILEERIVELTRGYPGDFSILSFNFKTIVWYKRNAPYINRGLNISKIDSYLIKQNKMALFEKVPFLREKLLRKLSPDFLSYDIDLVPIKYNKFTKKMHIPLISWTIDTLEKRDKAKKLTDNFIFERINPFE